MKIKLSFLIFLGIFVKLNAQINQNSKNDYNWLIGFWDIIYKPNGWNYDFNKKPVDIKLVDKLLKGDLLTANICDVNGNLVFYTNGCKIADKNNNIILGGDTLNNGYGYKYLCSSGYSYAPNQGTFILPSFKDTTSYFIFHLREAEYIDSRVGFFGVDKLLNTKIQKNNLGQLEVAYKDSVILDYKTDSLIEAGQLTATKHANGRDWWIITPKVFEPNFIKLLYSPYGIAKKVQKNIGSIGSTREYGGGMAVFSPDGTKYVRCNNDSKAQIFDFNRCIGELTNFRQILFKDDANDIRATGCAISPNSRYLYMTSSTKMYQFDLQSDSIEKTKYTFEVDTTFADTTQGGKLYTLFYTCQLGPDGKIYIASTGGRKYMHVINKPDLPGAACELKQNAITLPVYITWAIPFFPNYRLGALKGSPCDTLNATPTSEIPFNGTFKIFPNPASDYIKIDFTLPDYSVMDSYKIQIVDILGRVSQTKTLSKFASIKNMDVSELSSGLYFVQLVNSFGSILVQNKLVIER